MNKRVNGLPAMSPREWAVLRSKLVLGEVQAGRLGCDGSAERLKALRNAVDVTALEELSTVGGIAWLFWCTVLLVFPSLIKDGKDEQAN